MQYRLFTISLSNWRIAKERNIPLVDITAKSGEKVKGISVFGPFYRHLWKIKKGEMSEEEYTKHYLKRMEKSKLAFPNKWLELTEQPIAAFACYCGVGQYCHRKLFVEILKKYLEDLGHEVILEGELTQEGKEACH